MDRFLEKLNTQVALLAGCGGETLYYRDTSATLPDGRWQDPLLRALTEECNVLLALYTPGYFRQEAGQKCYCGREFSVFLRRTSGSHVNIVPVLWLIDEPPPTNMVPGPLHPLDWYICRDKDCEITAAKIQQYERKGLQSVWANSRGERDKIIDDLARRIYRWAKTPPPPLVGPLDMADEDCAFHPGETAERRLPSIGAASPAQAADGKALTVVYVDDGQVPAATQNMIERVGQELGNFVDVRRWSADDGVDALRRGAERNPAIILAAQAASLQKGAQRSALESLIADDHWIGGILQLDGDAGLTPAPSVPVRSAQASEDGIRGQLSTLVAETRNALVRFANPVTTPPASRPLPRL